MAWCPAPLPAFSLPSLGWAARLSPCHHEWSWTKGHQQSHRLSSGSRGQAGREHRRWAREEAGRRERGCFFLLQAVHRLEMGVWGTCSPSVMYTCKWRRYSCHADVPTGYAKFRGAMCIYILKAVQKTHVILQFLMQKKKEIATWLNSTLKTTRA